MGCCRTEMIPQCARLAALLTSGRYLAAATAAAIRTHRHLARLENLLARADPPPLASGEFRSRGQSVFAFASLLFPSFLLLLSLLFVMIRDRI